MMLLLSSKKQFLLIVKILAFIGLGSLWSNSRAIQIKEEEEDSEVKRSSGHGSNSKEYAPVIVNAGHGTTGTHSFVDVTCNLGYTSFHFKDGCLPEDALTNRSSATHDYYEVDGRTNVRRGLRHGSHRHRHRRHLKNEEKENVPLKRAYKELINTHVQLIETFKGPGRDFELPKLKQTYVALIEKLVIQAKDLNITLALHDSPYPYLMPTIIDKVKKHHDGKLPLILLSERDPMTWTKKRISDHPSIILCKDPVVLSPVNSGSNANNSTKNTAASTNPFQKINSHTLVGGAFDIIGCIENGIQNNAYYGTDVFDEIGDMTEELPNNGIITTIASHFYDYQTSVRDNHASFAYDMFLQLPNRTNYIDLTTKVVNSVGQQNLYRSMDIIKRGINLPTMTYKKKSAKLAFLD